MGDPDNFPVIIPLGIPLYIPKLRLVHFSLFHPFIDILSHFQSPKMSGQTISFINLTARLYQSRIIKHLAGLKAYDMKVVSAVDIDDTRKKKLVDFHKREMNLTDQERIDFTKLRQAIYSEYRNNYKMKIEAHKSHPGVETSRTQKSCNVFGVKYL